MSERKLTQRMFSLTLVALLLAGCRGSPSGPTATSVSALRTVASTSVSPTPTFAPVPPTTTPVGNGGQVAFTSKRDGNYEIYVMNANGSGQANLTNHEANDKRPSISPDGKRIAFVSDRDGNWEIYLINADGTGLVRLTNTPGWEDFPIWSPDGTHIVFIREFNALVIDPDGSNQTNLTSEPWADSRAVYMLGGKQMPGADLYPAWMPDGTQVVFLSVRDRSFQFYVVNIDGSRLTILDSGLPPRQTSPEQMVYLVSTGLDQNYLTTSGGAAQPMNDTGLGLGEFPAWSPDGTRIAFHSDRDGDMDIYVVSVDRSDIVRLTDNEATDVYPTWSPDGTRIAFASDRDGNLEIYVMNADGTEQTRMTDNSAIDYLPSWYR
jgi:Tol biopolymer transport system component